MNKVIIVTGPTGIGKSNLGVEICEKIGSEIVSCDSIQIYKGLNIGSAKMTESEARGIKQHMIDIVDPNQQYSVYDFQQKAREIINELHNAGKVPVVVGGTGLYLKALIYDYAFETFDRKKENIKTYDKLSNEELFKILENLDKQSTIKLHPNNRKRVERALSLALNGRTKTEIEDSQEHKLIYDCYFIECTTDRTLINEKVNKRVDEMVEMGLEEEISNLLETYPDLWSYQSMQGIGYREWQNYFLGNTNLNDTVELIKRDTRRLVKKQYTWIKHQLPQRWVDVTNDEEREKIINEVSEWIK